MEIKKRPKTAAVNSVFNPFASSNTQKNGKAQNLSYKDYTIKEENSIKLAKQAKSNTSDLKTTLTSMRPSTAHTDTAFEFKQKVQKQLNNFMLKKERNMIDDDDSLLQDSQASKTRDEKQAILQQQKAKRQKEAQLKQQQIEEAARKTKLSLQALEKHAKDNLSKQAKQKGSLNQREKERERSLKKKTQELVNRHRPVQDDIENLGATAQLHDLRSWIEKQIQQENLDEISSIQSETEAYAKQMTSNENVTNTTVFSAKESVQVSEKHKTKSQKSQIPGNSLLSEQEESKLGARQNRYGVFETGADEFKQVVQIQKEKLEPKVISKTDNKLTVEQQKVGKDQMRDMIMKLAQRAVGQGALPNSILQSVLAPVKDELSEDSCDKVPVRDNSKGNRNIINLKVKEVEQIQVSKLPGVTETKKTQAEIDQVKNKKESNAALVIQRFIRGHWGRRQFQRQLYRRRHDIEMEYDRFDKEYKQKNQYNIKQYLNDKQKIRKQNGLDSITEEIAEIIGESSGSTAQVSGSVKFQNFLSAKMSKSDHDPLSLISIYAKRHKGLPEQTQSKQTKIKGKTETQQSKKQDKKRNVIQSSSDIVEDIYSEKDAYSEKFDDEIEEDIPQGSSSLGSAPQKNNKKQKQVIESDSIIDEVTSAHLSKSGGQSDSIVDEAASAKIDSQTESSILEDSIIRDEFASDNVKVSQAEKSLEARNRGRFGISTTSAAKNLTTYQQEVLIKAEEENAANAVKHKNMMTGLLSEMKEYEAANINTTMMDRMEKIVISSLAQKDQIIMAQSLAELERELRHKEEINRIREEQIKFMSQLMLLGGISGSATQTSSNDAQRQELFSNIQKMAMQQVPQPQSVQQVPMTHQQLYQQAIQSQSSQQKLSYLDEYDLQNKSYKKYNTADLIQSQSQSEHNAKSQFKPEVKIQKVDSEDDIVDEIGSIQDGESIMEDIEESIVSSYSQSGQLEDLKKRQLKLVADKKTTIEAMTINIEEAIDREKDKKEKKLNKKLKQRMVSPKSFQRLRSDIESWATIQRKELRDSSRKLTLEKQIADQQQKFVAEQKASQLRVQSNLKLVEDSNDSDQVKQAINQAHLYDQGIIGASADQKYIQRKKDAAERLLQEKEKVIQEQLKQKMLVFEKGKADDDLQRALELNVEDEVQRRFEAVKRQLEESNAMESARSAISQSRDSQKVKKNVKFADLAENKGQKLSYNNTPAEPIESSQQEIEESIQESLVDSNSQSLKSSSALASISKSDKSLVKPIQSNLKSQTFPVARSKDHEASNSIQEMISDNYSEDFAASSDNQESSKFTNSRTKLQQKAKDIAVTQSDQYSEEDFENESIQQSQSANNNQQLENKPKMEPVKEESIGQSSKSESPLQEQESVPSEDQTVQNSVRSVDWQLQIADESARTGQEYSQENFEQSELKESINEDSSMNDRIEEDDYLESNPDEIDKSISMSDDINSKAEKIAQELLDLILAEYKGDNTYIVSCEKKQIDEEEFRNKFPYTLDVKVPEHEIRPPTPTTIEIVKNNSASKPAPKQKTPKEIADQKYIQQHETNQLQLKKQQESYKDYLEFLIKRVDLNQLIDALDKPIEQNPLQVLAQIQAYDDEEPPQVDEPEQQQVLTQAFFNKIDREYFAVQKLQSQDQSKGDQEKIQNVHNYALFEALNEALDLKRPYKNRGGPMPWSKNIRVVKQSTSVNEARKILDTALAQVLTWSVTGAGSKFAPLPPPPTQTQDEFGDEIIQPPLVDGEEDRKNQNRQEKLGQLMTQDINETDGLWIDYEVEDTQARFDLADMILADLAAEIAELLM